MADLGPRPADPTTIRFDRDCFEAAGEEIEYTVSRSALHAGPAVFSSRADAEDYARRCNRPVSERKRTIWRRVKWN
jgi:hypothetical protein